MYSECKHILSIFIHEFTAKNIRTVGKHLNHFMATKCTKFVKDQRRRKVKNVSCQQRKLKF